MERYFLEPYRFVPPYRGTLWCRLGRGFILRQMKRNLGITRWHVAGLETFRKSISDGAGILLTPNHCRWADPMLMGAVSCEARQYFYYIASHHIFRQGKVRAWVLNRLGGYSICREGADRESLKETARVLADAERPVVLFPEGTWFRQNDRVGMLQDGLSLITRQAARQSKRPIHVQPIGIKYWLLEEPTKKILERLESLERRIGWWPQVDLPLLDRIEKLGGGLLALKEIEFLGQAHSGDIDSRIARLTESQVDRLEKQHLGKRFDGWLLERIRRLRQQLLRQMHDKAASPETIRRVKKDLEDLLFFENVSAHSMEYLRSDPNPERIVETVQRIEETMLDLIEVPIVPVGAAVQFGAPLDVRTFAAGDRKEGDPLVKQLRVALQGLIDGLVAKGPPAEWNCPPRPPRVQTPAAAMATPDLGAIAGLPPGQLIG